ncbi:MAG: hypothetical protein ACREPI_00990 [Candidatus Dormibacterales bacterium]
MAGRRRLLVLALAAGAAAALAPVSPAGAGASAGTHLAGVRRAAHRPSASQLASHGGPVETAPAVYIDWWGPSWASGFKTGGYSSAAAQAYVTGFFTNVGGTSWINSTAQYCQGVPRGTTSCAGHPAALHVTNPAGQLKGAWEDTSPVPASVSQAGVAAEAARAAAHFGFDPDATYFVFTPHGVTMSGFGTAWCAWHAATASPQGRLAYAFMPYVPDAGAGCGKNFVNRADDAFGNGYFDGFSVVGGHEYAEAETDPRPSSGWVAPGGAENGDKCAWAPTSGDIALADGHRYAVQPLWSNAARACVMSA